ncbi:glycerophosphodiester phosphodiesterase family protein [Leucobacter komagatae]|uniref:Glycerophosphodiester phosphodiesterase n=1 Tax=Leucobacter komagatae TaxID=55969 RepID=A0A0D0H7E1_9MICO|nr:glycerophosphodiester phosphodiesterase family protein [Leucobacter komagatae]KIP53090.1 glycerophosphodiester phosphodiesterase [Leucobacter komagatae]
MSHPFFGEGPKPRIFGHRGFVSAASASAGVVENSREAIAAALAAGVDFVESDCQLTADGRVVLFHDATLTRTLGDPRRVSAVDYAELAELMELRGGLLTLDEAVTDFPEARFNIDMKSAAVAEPAGAIVGQLAPDRVLIGSFSEALRLRSLAAARAASGVRPATGAGQRAIVRILTAVAMRSKALLDRAFSGVDALQIPERQGPVRVLSDRLLNEAHTRGVEVHVWTVNASEHMLSLARQGVDGLITDRADVAVGLFR